VAGRDTSERGCSLPARDGWDEAPRLNKACSRPRPLPDSPGRYGAGAAPPSFGPPQTAQPRPQPDQQRCRRRRRSWLWRHASLARVRPCGPVRGKGCTASKIASQTADGTAKREHVHAATGTLLFLTKQRKSAAAGGRRARRLRPPHPAAAVAHACSSCSASAPRCRAAPARSRPIVVCADPSAARLEDLKASARSWRQPAGCVEGSCCRHADHSLSGQAGGAGRG
jgi:hypothetical protein